jgi:hypothetical protein
MGHRCEQRVNAAMFLLRVVCIFIVLGFAADLVHAAAAIRRDVLRERAAARRAARRRHPSALWKETTTGTHVEPKPFIMFGDQLESTTAEYPRTHLTGPR